MTVEPLSSSDRDTLAAAAACAKANDPQGAAEALAGLSTAGRAHPQARYLNALVLAGHGDVSGALAELQVASTLAPDDPAIQGSLIRLLSHVAHEQPSHAPHWAALGAAELARGNPDAAAAAYARAVGVDPKDRISWHNLGTALRAIDRPEEALAAIGTALEQGLQAPETATVRAHLLAELGHFDAAIDQYRAVLAQAPDHLDAHRQLAQLLPELGRPSEALDGYRSALVIRPLSADLWHAALDAAHNVKDHGQALAWAHDAAATLGPLLAYDLYAANALSGLDRDEEARDLLLKMLAGASEELGVHLNLAAVFIRLRDLPAAEYHALAATRIAPLDQYGWALLGVVWRLTSNAREEWLCDYDRLVMPIDVPEPPTRIDLIAVLDTLHLARAHPANQSLRGGTQTRGQLFDRRRPEIQQLAQAFRGSIEARIATLPRDETHPFLMRNTGRIGFAGSWSVKLRGAGFHINHIHHGGWISSAYYASLPPEVGGADGAGSLTFGEPDAQLRTGLAPQKILLPIPGRLVIFPSYFWHGTVPFESASPRITVAMDAYPMP